MFREVAKSWILAYNLSASKSVLLVENGVEIPQNTPSFILNMMCNLNKLFPHWNPLSVLIETINEGKKSGVPSDILVNELFYYMQNLNIVRERPLINPNFSLKIEVKILLPVPTS